MGQALLMLWKKLEQGQNIDIQKNLALLTLPILPLLRQRQIFLYHVMKSC